MAAVPPPRRVRDWLPAVLILAGLALWLWTRAEAFELDPAFLAEPAGFAPGHQWGTAVESIDPRWHIVGAGLWNTVRVSALSLVLATLLGVLAGTARLSRNGLVRRLAAGYVSAFRNTPLAVQIVFWYTAALLPLPPVSEALSLGPLLLSNRGIALPLPGLGWPTVVGTAGGVQRIAGGLVMSPEFCAVALALSAYTGAYIAEVVRGSIQALPPGQAEAAASLGLSRGQALRLIVLPQALRTMIPALTNQYLNLVKNSSLGFLVAFPELFSVSETIINHAGHAIPMFGLVIVCYMLLNLLISTLMGLLHRRLLAVQGPR